jgi:hypothetical protein
MNNMTQEQSQTITIPLSEYNSLRESAEWLGYLEAAGVDNWSGVEYAFELKHQDNPELKDE